MEARGFSLIELIVVLAIAAILLSLATLQFVSMSQKSAIESQVRLMYADLLEVRQKALYEKTARAVLVTATQFNVYSDGSTSGIPTMSRTLSYPVTATTTPLVVVFNTYGIAGDGSTTSFICVSDPSDAVVDSIIVDPMRIELGKRNAGGDCADGSITRK